MSEKTEKSVSGFLPRVRLNEWGRRLLGIAKQSGWRLCWLGLRAAPFMAWGVNPPRKGEFDDAD
jgi:hypothetical protein